MTLDGQQPGSRLLDLESESIVGISSSILNSMRFVRARRPLCDGSSNIVGCRKERTPGGQELISVFSLAIVTPVVAGYLSLVEALKAALCTEPVWAPVDAGDAQGRQRPRRRSRREAGRSAN